jgi:hypothetical protein
VQAVQHLCNFMFTSNVALQAIEHQELKASYACLGVTLPCRKTLSGPRLEEKYQQVDGHYLDMAQFEQGRMPWKV